MKLRYAPTLLLGLLLATACNPDRGRNQLTVRGYAPVYAPAATSRQINAGPVQPSANPGKIYAYQHYLFQVEQGKGIHVIDNRVPQQAAKMAFINVPGCSEIAVKNGYLYTNNVADLVVVNIADPTVPVEVSRQANAFPEIEAGHPPFSGVYFECVDPKKGVVIGWEEKQLQNPQCRR